MNSRRLLQQILDATDWSKKRALLGGAEFVPSAVIRLAGAESAEEATEEYWKLDNRIVVQGSVFESARFVVGPLLFALQAGVSREARLRIVNLLVEIALGEPDETEIEMGNAGLNDTCRADMREGLWQFYGLWTDDDPDIRIGSILVLDAIEADRARLRTALGAIVDGDPDVRVRECAREVRERGSAPDL